jgi:hypothetical protein
MARPQSSFVFRIASLIVLSSTENATSQNNSAGDDALAISPGGEVIRLFDGKTLGDCYTWLKDAKREDPRKVFSVENGLIRVSGDGLGAIVTNKRYRDYHLVLEYRWGERTWHEREKNAKDSGLLINSNGMDGGYDGAWMPSIEVQIIQGGVGDFVPVPGKGLDGKPAPLSLTTNSGRDRDGEVIWQPEGKRETFSIKDRTMRRINWYGRDPDWEDVKDFRGPEDKDSPGQAWTRIDVILDGEHVQTFVNGTKVNEAFDIYPAEGRLQLQSELAEIHFRRWELWPLGKGPKPAPAPAEQ